MSKRGECERKSPASSGLFYRELGEVGKGQNKQGHPTFLLALCYTASPSTGNECHGFPTPSTATPMRKLLQKQDPHENRVSKAMSIIGDS
jgi:hypothetical protein